jgi:hypothetical protein
MEYHLSQEQLYKIMKPFFDYRFKNSKLDIRNYEGETWKGLWGSDGQLLVGSTNYEDDSNYYYNGEYFGGEWEIFNINISVFTDMMTLYLEEEYDLKINSLA